MGRETIAATYFMFFYLMHVDHDVISYQRGRYTSALIKLAILLSYRIPSLNTLSPPSNVSSNLSESQGALLVQDLLVGLPEFR